MLAYDARVGFWDKLLGGDAPKDPPRCPAGPRAGEYRNGKKQGPWIEVITGDAGATYLGECVYRDGVRHGPIRQWRTSDRTLYETGTVVGGHYDGLVRRFHSNGTIASEISYANGELQGVARYFDPGGTLTSEKEYRGGRLWTGMQEYGIERGRLEQGKKVGIWEKLAWDKRIAERGPYVGGVRHGRFELRDSDWESWHGEIANGERVGEWELHRDQSKVIAKGEYPRGARVTWTATLGEKRLAFEIATPLELARWIRVVETAFAGTKKHDFTHWPDDERQRARAWLDANVAIPPRIAKRKSVVAHPPFPESLDPEDDAEPFEAHGRDVLVYATGDIGGLAHPATPAFDEATYEYMKHWYPPAAGTLVVIGTIELPGRMIVDSPESRDEKHVYAFRPGTYELVGLDSGDRLHMPAAIVRLRGGAVARWRYLGAADDDHYGLFAPDVDLRAHDWPEHPGDEVQGPAEWIRPDVGPTVWITNPTGNGIRAYAGVTSDGELVAVFLQLY